MEFNLTPVPACQTQPTNLRSRLKRFLLISAGVLALFLAALGVVLPGLPTTPFVLLAAGCFAKASPTLHHWLLNRPRLGAMVRDWETHRSLPLRVKRLACGLMLVMVAVSAWQLAHLPLVAVSVLLLGVLGGWVIWWRIPTR
ncbi:MAG: YbaN family protein [Burkholderiales bacterium]|nr:YbaN family protein [Burkholderiales bacterium]